MRWLLKGVGESHGRLDTAVGKRRRALLLLTRRCCGSEPKRLKDHYGTLGVPQNASAAVIKAAYYEMSKAHHPDSATSGDAVAFQNISDAYQVLGNVQRRRDYDRQLTAWSERVPHDPTVTNVYSADFDMDYRNFIRFRRDLRRRGTWAPHSFAPPEFWADSSPRHFKSFYRRPAAEPSARRPLGTASSSADALSSEEESARREGLFRMPTADELDDHRRRMRSVEYDETSGLAKIFVVLFAVVSVLLTAPAVYRSVTRDYEHSQRVAARDK